MAQLALGVVGGIAGSFIGMPQLGFAVGSAIGGYLTQPDLPDTQGPRLSDLSSAGAVEGSDIIRAWGNVRLTPTPVFSPPLVEVLTTEDVGGKGGPSGSHTTATYYLTQLLSVGHVPPGTLLRRIYANKTLVYDASANADAVSAGYRFTWYDGSQTEPDPVYESYVGAGNAAAYKGQGLLLVDGWDVTTEFGSRPPLIEVEICTNGTNVSGKYSVDIGVASHSLEYQWQSEYRKTILMSFSSPNLIAEIDPASSTLIKTISEHAGVMRPFTRYPDPGGTQTETGRYLLTFDKTGDTAAVYDMEDWSVKASWNIPNRFAHVVMGEVPSRVLFRDDQGLHWLNKETLQQENTVPAIPTGFSLQHGAISSGDAFLVHLNRDSDGAVAFAKLYPDSISSWAWSTPVVPSELTGYRMVQSGVVADDDGLVWWAAETSAFSEPVLVSTDFSGSVFDVLNIEFDLNGGAGSWSPSSGQPLLHFNQQDGGIWFNYYGVIRRFDQKRKTIEKFATGDTGAWCVFHAPTQSCWMGKTNDGSGRTTANRVRVRVVEPVPVAVDTIITDITDAVPDFDTATDLNLTALSPMPTVDGYVQIRQSTARAVLDPLVRAVLAEAVVSDWQLKVVPLGGPVVATLSAQDMGARSGTESTVAPLEEIEPESVALPGRFQLGYISTDRELQPAMVSSEFAAAGSGKTVTIEIPFMASDADASTLCQILHQLAIETTQLKFSLPRRYAQLEPTDPILVPRSDGSTTRARLTRVDRGANGVLACEAVTDLVSHLTADAVAGGSGLTAATILSSSPAELIVLDTPLLRDADADHPGPYLTAFTYGPGFPGVSFNASADGQTFTAFAGLGAEPVLGTCQTVPVSADFEAWDDTNVLRVTVRTSGNFSGTTDANLLAGANAVAWGKPGRWEVLHFGAATQIDSTTWDLSHLLRGRRGTDWAMDLHNAGDWFVVLNAAATVRHVLAVGDIGSQRYYRAPNVKQALSDARSTTWAVGDVPLKPYSPIGLAITFAGKDASVNWTRRTRGGGTYGGVNGLTDGVGGPLREDNESYLITVQNDAGTALNTYTHNGPPPWAYPESAILADYGSYPSKIHIEAAQISAAAGAGYARKKTQSTPVSSAYVAAVETDGASHMWRLDDTSATAFDLIGSLNGTYGGTYTQSQPSLLADTSGASVAVNGGYIEVPAHVDLTSMQTVELLLNPAAFAATTANAAIASCSDPTQSLNGFTLSLQNDGGLFLQIKNGSTGVLNLTAEGLTAIGSTVHAAIEWDGFTTADEVRLVVNGVVAASGYPSANWSIGTNPLRVGQSTDSTWEVLDGLVQELAIYPTAVPVPALLNHAAHAGTVDYATLVDSLSPTLNLRLGESTGTVASDSSPNGLNGTYVGSPTLGVAGAITGDPDTAVAFDGVGSYVEVPDNPLFNGLAQMTLCAWVRLDDVSGDNVVIAKDAVTTGDRAFTLFFTDFETSPAAEAKLSFYAAGGAATARSLSTVVPGPDWIFVAAVYDGLNDPAVYINGTDVTDPATAASTVTALPTTTANLRVANDSRAAQTTLLAGAVDEVNLYPAALTPAQIKQLYDNGRL